MVTSALTVSSSTSASAASTFASASSTFSVRSSTTCAAWLRSPAAAFWSVCDASAAFSLNESFLSLALCASSLLSSLPCSTVSSPRSTRRLTSSCPFSAVVAIAPTPARKILRSPSPKSGMLLFESVMMPPSSFIHRLDSANSTRPAACRAFSVGVLVRRPARVARPCRSV